MVGAEVRRKALEMPGLPTIPEVLSRIVHTSQDASSSAADLGAAIEADHAITARVLRLANSAFYGRARRIATVRQAIVLVGFESVRLLALATSVIDSVSALRQVALDPHDFWMHSFGSALAAREVERELGIGRADSICFSAALLHDIGKYILAACYGQAYAKALAGAASSGRRIHEVEREQFGTHYGEVAAWLGTRWQFPEPLVETIRYVPVSGAYRGPMAREVRVVALAEQLACISGFGCAGDSADRAVDPTLAQDLSMRPDAIPRLVEQLASSRDRTRRMLSEWGAS